MMATISPDIRIIAFVKGDERYIWMFPESRLPEALQSVGRCASDPELSFTWYDAVLIGKQMRQGQNP